MPKITFEHVENVWHSVEKFHLNLIIFCFSLKSGSSIWGLLMLAQFLHWRRWDSMSYFVESIIGFLYHACSCINHYIVLSDKKLILFWYIFYLINLLARILYPFSREEVEVTVSTSLIMSGCRQFSWSQTWSQCPLSQLLLYWMEFREVDSWAMQ